MIYFLQKHKKTLKNILIIIFIYLVIVFIGRLTLTEKKNEPFCFISGIGEESSGGDKVFEKNMGIFSMIIIEENYPEIKKTYIPYLMPFLRKTIIYESAREFSFIDNEQCSIEESRFWEDEKYIYKTNYASCRKIKFKNGKTFTLIDALNNKLITIEELLKTDYITKENKN